MMAGAAAGVVHRREEFLPPALDVVAFHDIEHLSLAPFDLVLGHRQRLLQAGDQIIGIVRVGQHRALELGGGTGEFGQHHHRVAALDAVRGDKLLGHQVQAIAQRRDPHHLRGGIVRHHLLERQAAREEAHR